MNADRTFRPQRFPLLTTAHGQAYLAFCSAQEREAILKMLRASKSRGNAIAHETALVNKTLAEVRNRGYALRPADAADRVIGFAVPVLHGQGVAATIGMRYFGTAMSPEETVRRYLKILQNIAAAVADGLTHHDALYLPATSGST